MLRSIFRNAGANPHQFVSSIRGWQRYLRDKTAYLEQSKNDDFLWGTELPMLNEWNEASGSLGHYFYQDQLVARWVHEAMPTRHIDVGSRLDGFIGTLSVFRPVDAIDIRPNSALVHNVTFHQMDLMEEVPLSWQAATDSLSCLHTIEHFGLGRFGDTIDCKGHLKGLEHMMCMVKPGGIFYLSTPIGPQRIEFNAHRIFAAQTLIDWFTLGWNIERFAVIDDRNCIHESVDWRSEDAANHFGCQTGLGIIAARKLP